MFRVVTLAAALLLCAAPACCQTNNDTELTFAAFVSGLNTTVEGGDGRPFLTAFDLAIEMINNQTDILPGYTLSYVTNDSRCQAGPSVRSFIEQIFREPTKIMIIGADCSVSSEPIAELAPFYNLVQVSPVSTSIPLSVRNAFPTFYRMVASDAVVVEGIVGILLEFNWSRIAVISQQESIFTSTLRVLEEVLPALNLSSPREFSFNTGDNPQDNVQRLQNSPTRIIFVNTYQTYALEILCQAAGLGMTHLNGYVWLLYGWYAEEWWLAPPDPRSYTPITCDQRTIEDMLEFAILVDHFPVVLDWNEPTDVANMTRADWDSLFSSSVADDFPGGVDDSYFDQAPFFFDAMWTAALALNATQAEYNLSLFEYDPESEVSVNISRSIQENILQQEFQGISGRIAFTTAGDRISQIRFSQYQRNSSDQLVTVQIGNELDFVFPLGVPVDEMLVFISLPLFIIYTVLSCIGILFAAACLIVNLIFRNRNAVNYSSPYLNVVIIIGVVLFYIDVILFGLDEQTTCRSTVNNLCMTRVWVATIAFSLVFGTIFAKTWRVYYVFLTSTRHKKMAKFLVRDYFLLGMVGVLLLVDLAILIPSTAVTSSRLELRSDELSSSSDSQSLPQIISVCRAEDRDIWLGILLAYKGLLIIVSLFFAFETRKAKIRHINDIRVIGMSVLGIAILSVVLTAVGILLEEFVTVLYAVVGILVLFGCTGLLLLLFIPKFYGLWKDPEGAKEEGSGFGDSAKATTREEAQGTISKLSQEVEQLKKELREVTSQPEVVSKTGHKENGDSDLVVVNSKRSSSQDRRQSSEKDGGIGDAEDTGLSVVSVTVHVGTEQVA